MGRLFMQSHSSPDAPPINTSGRNMHYSTVALFFMFLATLSTANNNANGGDQNVGGIHLFEFHGKHGGTGLGIKVIIVLVLILIPFIHFYVQFLSSSSGAGRSCLLVRTVVDPSGRRRL